MHLLKSKKEDRKDKEELVSLLSASCLGLNMVVSTAIGLGLGLFFDKLFKTGPFLTLIFLLLGIFAGFWQIIKEINKLNKDDKKKS